MMKKLLSLLLGVAIAASSLTACSNNDTKSKEESTSITSESTTSKVDTENASETKEISVDYSKNFKIEILENGIKKVTDGEDRELILVPKSLGEIPAEYKDSIVITTPVENAVFLSATQLSMLRVADNDDIWDAVGAVNVDRASLKGLDKITSRMDSGKIISVGGEMGQPDYEQIQALNPDVVFLYTGEYGQQDAIAKLDELGINYAVDNDYLEKNYLARMEWMKFVLSFYNAEDDAMNYMLNTKKTVDDIKGKLEGVEGKKVAIFSMFDGLGYATNDNSWVGSIIKEMGGINVFSDINEDTITAEGLFSRVQDADVIIYSATPEYCDGLTAIEEAFPQIKECEAYKNGGVYQFSDLYWLGIDQTDIIASDLASIINPDIFKDNELTYYIKLK